MAKNRLRNLDLGTLRSFAAIAESGSMTRAAARLYMTQSAISMQIKRLEKSLGLSVFDRSSQGMTTTVEGDQLLHFAHQMLAINDEAMGRLTSSEYEGQIRLGVPSDIIYPHIPGILAEYSREFPRVQLKLSTAPTVDLISEFQAGQQDLVLTTEVSPQSGGRLIGTESLVWMGAENGSVWKKRPLPLGIYKNCAFRVSAINALDRFGLDWIDIVTSEDVIAGDAMTSADLCISAELESVRPSGRAAIDHGGLLPDLPDVSIMLYAKQGPDNHLVDTLAETLLRVYS